MLTLKMLLEDDETRPSGFKYPTPPCALAKILGSFSTRVFETRTATGREHFTCQDSGVSQIFVLIISNGEKILCNVIVVV